MDGVVDRRSREAADFEQVPALRLELRHLLDFLLAHVLEVDDHAIGARLGDDAVEGDDDDAGVAGLLDRAVQRVGRSGVDDDRVIALQDEVLDLGGLGRHFLVGGRENIGCGDDLVRHRLLADDVIALQHRLAPGIAGVIVGKGDLLVARVGQRRRGEKPGRCGQCEHRDVAIHENFLPRGEQRAWDTLGHPRLSLMQRPDKAAAAADDR